MAKPIHPNPAIAKLIAAKKQATEHQLTSYNHCTITADDPFAYASKALGELFLQAQGKEWCNTRDYTGTGCKINPVAGGDAAAIAAYAHLVCEHVKNLNLLIATHRKFLLPYSQKCFCWPVRISKRKPFGDDAVDIIRQLQVGSDTIAGDPTARFNPDSKFGKVAWTLIQRIEQCRNEPAFVPAWCQTKENWARDARSLPPLTPKPSTNDKDKWLAVVKQVLKDDFQNPNKRAYYRSLIKAKTHQRHWESRLVEKVCGEFESLWGLHRKAKS